MIDNAIGCAGAAAVAGALKGTTTVTNVDLAGEAVREAAVEVAHSHTAARNVMLDNAISRAGAVAIADALMVNRSVTNLALSGE